MSLLYRQRYIVISLSSDKCTYCKSLWIKASAERPECKRKNTLQGLVRASLWVSTWCTAPGVGGDLAEVSQAALHDGGGVALRQVHLPVVVLRGRVLRQLRRPGVGLLTAAHLQEVPRPGGHAGVGVDAAVGGRALDVGEAQHLGVHEVPGAKVLLVAVAGGVAGEGVAAGVAGGLVSRLEEERRRRDTFNYVVIRFIFIGRFFLQGTAHR